MLNKILGVFTGFLFILSCRQPVKNSAVKEVKDTGAVIAKPAQQPVEPVYNEGLLQQYANYLGNLDTTYLEGCSNAAKKYIQLFKDQNKNTCDSAFFIFNDGYYARLNGGLDSMHRADTALHYDSLIYKHYLPSAKLAVQIKKLKDNGFKIYAAEGDTYVGEDLDFVAKWFYPYVSSTLKVYLTEINKEDKEGFIEDAGLVITPRQLIDRTVWWEQFYNTNPKTIVTGKSNAEWKSYLATFMKGMDNSPVVDRDKSIDIYYKNAFGYLQTKYPGSQTYKLLAPYYQLLLQKQSIKAAAMIKIYEKEGMIRN